MRVTIEIAHALGAPPLNIVYYHLENVTRCSSEASFRQSIKTYCYLFYNEHVNLTLFDQNLIVPGDLPTRGIVRTVLSHCEDIDFKASKQRDFQAVLDSSLLQKIKTESDL